MTWTPEKAKEIRALLDTSICAAGRRTTRSCRSRATASRNPLSWNQILGSKTLVSVRGPAGTPTVDAWKRFSDQLSQSAARIRAAGMTLGFHNHDIEFKPVEGTRPMDILASNKDITSFHLNIGLCLKGGGDPVAFMKQCPGRIQSILVQDYQGQARWNEIFAAAEGAGGLYSTCSNEPTGCPWWNAQATIFSILPRRTSNISSGCTADARGETYLQRHRSAPEVLWGLQLRSRCSPGF